MIVYCKHELGLESVLEHINAAQTNIGGGGIGLSHPIGVSGVMLAKGANP